MNNYIKNIFYLGLLIFSEFSFSFGDLNFESLVQGGTSYELLTPEQKKAIDAFIEIEQSNNIELSST